MLPLLHLLSQSLDLRGWLGVLDKGNQAAAERVAVLPALRALERGHLTVLGVSLAQVALLGARAIRLLLLQGRFWQFENLVARGGQVEVAVSLVVMLVLELMLVGHGAVDGGVDLVQLLDQVVRVVAGLDARLLVLLKVVECLQAKQLVDFLLRMILPLLVPRSHDPDWTLLHRQVCEYAASGCGVLSTLLLLGAIGI